MKTQLLGSLAAICLSSLFIAPAYADAPVCEPQVQEAPVRLPRRALELQETGVVILRAEVDATGRARAVNTVVSSGKSRLDTAATRAVTKRWLFDVSHCAAAQLPAVKIVAIEFAPVAAQVAVSDTCFHSSRQSAYGRQRTKACLAAPTDGSALAAAK